VLSIGCSRRNHATTFLPEAAAADCMLCPTNILCELFFGAYLKPIFEATESLVDHTRHFF